VLHWTCQRRQGHELIQMLLDAGASCTLANVQSHTVFDTDLTGLVFRHMLWEMTDKNKFELFFSRCHDWYKRAEPTLRPRIQPYSPDIPSMAISIINNGNERCLTASSVLTSRVLPIQLPLLTDRTPPLHGVVARSDAKSIRMLELLLWHMHETHTRFGDVSLTGLSLRGVDALGRTPLIAAICAGNITATKILLEVITGRSLIVPVVKDENCSGIGNGSGIGTQKDGVKTETKKAEDSDDDDDNKDSDDDKDKDDSDGDGDDSDASSVTDKKTKKKKPKSKVARPKKKKAKSRITHHKKRTWTQDENGEWQRNGKASSRKTKWERDNISYDPKTSVTDSPTKWHHPSYASLIDCGDAIYGASPLSWTTRTPQRDHRRY
jgi:hypothetical protein